MVTIDKAKKEKKMAILMLFFAISIALTILWECIKLGGILKIVAIVIIACAMVWGISSK